MIVNIIKDSRSCSWKLNNLVQCARFHLQQLGYSFKHVHKEANHVADSLANFSFDSMQLFSFVSFDDLPREVKGLLLLDKESSPSLRFS